MNSLGLDRISRELALRKRLQEALLVFSKGVSAHLALDIGLETLVCDLNALFGTSRVSIWLHDRRARTLRQVASSDSRESQGTSSLSTDDDHVIAHGLRHEGPEIVGSGEAQTLTTPLRGWRRALGTVVFDGHARELDRELLIELAMDLSRQLSVAIESVV